LVANQGKRSAVPAECVLTASSKAAAVFWITDTSVPADKTLVDQTALIVREDNILKFTEVNCRFFSRVCMVGCMGS
jgi:hypothetical protein